RRCDDILDIVADRGSCDFLVDVAAELPIQANASFLGIPQEDRHTFWRWADATLDYEDRELGQTSARSADAAAAMAAYGTALLEGKRRCPVDDILSIVASAELPDEARPGGPLTQL